MSILQQDTDRVIAALLRRTIGEAETIGMRSVLAADIPRAIRTYVRVEVRGWITDEAGQGRRLGGILQAAEGGTMSALMENAVLQYEFPRAEFVATVQQSVHFVASYLCRPQWTLRQFLAGGGSVSGSVLRRRLASVAEYPYFPALIIRYLESRNVTSLTPAQLENLLEQIDALVVGRGSLADLAGMMRPLFEFFGFGLPADSGIPLQPILLFLADKRLQPTQDLFERRCRARGRSTVTMEELRAILTDSEEVVAGEPAPAPAPPAPAAPPDPPSPPAAPDPPAPSPRAARNIPLSLTYAGLTEQRGEGGPPPLEQFIRSEQRTFFIDALFGKDPAFYAGVVEALNRIPTWGEAAGYLRGLFEAHGVDPLSDEALEFVESVQTRYRSGGA